MITSFNSCSMAMIMELYSLFDTKYDIFLTIHIHIAFIVRFSPLKILFSSKFINKSPENLKQVNDGHETTKSIIFIQRETWANNVISLRLKLLSRRAYYGIKIIQKLVDNDAQQRNILSAWLYPLNYCIPSRNRVFVDHFRKFFRGWVFKEVFNFFKFQNYWKLGWNTLDSELFLIRSKIVSFNIS